MQGSAFLKAATAAGTAAAKPRFVRRPLNRVDIQFAFVVGFCFVPAAALLHFNKQAQIWVAPYLKKLNDKYEDLEPDLYLAFERMSGREGEVSEALRKRNAARKGEEYIPVVKFGQVLPPTKADIAALTDDHLRKKAHRLSAAAEDSPAAAVLNSNEKPLRRSASGAIDLDALVAAAESARKRQ